MTTQDTTEKDVATSEKNSISTTSLEEQLTTSNNFIQTTVTDESRKTEQVSTKPPETPIDFTTDVDYSPARSSATTQHSSTQINPGSTIFTTSKEKTTKTFTFSTIIPTLKEVSAQSTKRNDVRSTSSGATLFSSTNTVTDPIIKTTQRIISSEYVTGITSEADDSPTHILKSSSEYISIKSTSKVCDSTTLSNTDFTKSSSDYASTNAKTETDDSTTHVTKTDFTKLSSGYASRRSTSEVVDSTFLTTHVAGTDFTKSSSDYFSTKSSTKVDESTTYVTDLTISSSHTDFTKSSSDYVSIKSTSEVDDSTTQGADTDITKSSSDYISFSTTDANQHHTTPVNEIHSTISIPSMTIPASDSLTTKPSFPETSTEENHLPATKTFETKTSKMYVPAFTTNTHVTEVIMESTWSKYALINLIMFNDSVRCSGIAKLG